MKYDLLIVGAGFFGATFARLATEKGLKCLVVDKRDYVGGMAADVKMDNIITGLHGAHIFHTNIDWIWGFANRFTTMIPFINKPKVLSQGKVYSFPINLMTLHQLWGVVTPEEAIQKLSEVVIPCENPRNLEEWALSKIGVELYEKFVYGYTKKQWFKEPSELPASIIQRLPIRLTYEENYFNTKYQGMPQYGYTDMVNNLLDGIDVSLGVDFFGMNWEKHAKMLVYSGPIDRFFNYKLGKLEYNTLQYKFEKFEGDYQGNAVFNHVDLDCPYIRSIEHKHFYNHQPKHYTKQSKEVSIISYDIPVVYNDNEEPYYPIRDNRNSSLYSKYEGLKKDYPNVIFGGRLGEYKYFDIDQTIASAKSKFNKYWK